tara:strand:- start:32 stop:433 length:402 start_codon:yes stop_codon:yes gene_type:complete
MIEVNYLLVLGLAVFAMALGVLWYGPLFGRAWCKLNGVNPDNPVEVKRMQAGMGLVYVIQFVLTLLMVFVLYVYTKPAVDVVNEVEGALWLWAGLTVPALASAVMWTTESARQQRKRFLIQAGYFLVLARWSA